MQYLTIIGLALTTATFVCGLLADVEGDEWIFLAKNYLSMVATPLELLITILYWGLRMVCNPRFSPALFYSLLLFSLH